MYTVKTTDGKQRDVTRGEGLELVAGKQATWDPPLAKQMLAQGDAVKEKVEVDGVTLTHVVSATAADPPPRKK